MDDLQNQQPGGGAPETDFSDDTRTRKTVRLRPNMKMPTPINLAGADAPALADPMAGRDTDTGNLEVLDDTKTRRTVKLKPISPRPVISPAAKLQITPGVSPAAPAVAQAVTPVASEAKKTVVLPRPAAPGAASAASAASAGGESTNTVKVTRIIPAGAVNDDRTVKVQRLAVPPKIGPDHSQAASAEKATVKLPQPKRPPVSGPAVAAPVAAPVAAKIAPKSDKAIGIAPSAKKPEPVMPRRTAATAESEELAFSSAGTFFRVVIALLVTAATLFVAIQFCDIVCGTDIASSIPGFPVAK